MFFRKKIFEQGTKMVKVDWDNECGGKWKRVKWWMRVSCNNPALRLDQEVAVAFSITLASFRCSCQSASSAIPKKQVAFLSTLAHNSPSPAFHLCLLKSYLSFMIQNTTLPWLTLESIPPLQFLIESWVLPSFLPSTKYFSSKGSAMQRLRAKTLDPPIYSLWTWFQTQMLSASVSRPIKWGEVYSALLRGLNQIPDVKRLE